MIRLLDHIRVLDLTRLIPGAYCTQLLADLGASVLKVEQPGRGDYMRQLNPWVFGAMNRNKESITLNIKHPQGRELFLRLVEGHDVLVESFRPGVLARLKLGYDVVNRANPRIIFCSLSGYGQSGPYSLRSGHDLNYLAVSGVLGLTSDPGERPRALPLPLADLAGSFAASHAILAGLASRNHTQRGCYVDVSMTDAAVSLMSPRLALASGTGKTSRSSLIRGGSYDVYRTRDGRFLTLGIIEDAFWMNLCRALGMEGLAADPRFQTDRSRSENRYALRRVLEPILEKRDLKDWLELFEREDVPAASVNALDEVETDPQIQQRGLFFDLIDDAGCTSKQVGYPALFPGQEQREDRAAPAMGRDTWKVLRALGYSDADIKALDKEGAVSIPR